MDLSALLEPEVAPISRLILEEKVLHRHPDGSLKETPKEMFSRVASHIAEAERFHGGSEAEVETMATAFYDLMASRKFLPNSPCLVGAKTKRNGLLACFTLYPEDSMESIFETAKQMAIVHAAGGGTGFPFHTLRPAGSWVGGTRGGDTGGPLSFMQVYNDITDAVRQGGVRRGANLGVMRIDHPNTLDFIRCKTRLSPKNRALLYGRNGLAETLGLSDEQAVLVERRLIETQFNNFNISVGITDEFMQAVEADAEFPLRFGGKVYQALPARQIFDAIVEGAWQNGEPGLFFIDTANEFDPEGGALGSIEAGNPCLEQPLHDGQSCVLGSINLERFIANDCQDGLDWPELARVVQLAVRFLDNCIEMNRYPVEKIERVTKASRPIGVGVMGWHSLLMRLGVPYETDEAVGLAGQIMTFIRDAAVRESERLAEERGPCPIWPQTRWAKLGHAPRRNSRLTTVAPTGSVSLIANCSPAIEPVFGLGYRKFLVDGPAINVVEAAFERHVYHRFDVSESAAVLDHVIRTGSIRDLDCFSNYEKALFTNAREIDWRWHLKHQVAWQRNGVEAGCSKTINMPGSATREEVAEAIFEAWRQELIGFTVYRDGSRLEQVIRNVDEPDQADGAGIQLGGNTMIRQTEQSAVVNGTACTIDSTTGQKSCS